jgi:hypothetical protein
MLNAQVAERDRRLLTRRAVGSRVGSLLGRLPLHPLGMAAAPVLFLFAENQVQQVSLDPLWRPLGLAVLFGAALLIAGAALLRDWRRGALLASLVLVLFFSFGHAWNLVGDALGDRGWLAGIYLLVALLGALLIWRRNGPWVSSTTGFVNVAVLLLVVFNASRVADFALGSASPVADQSASLPPGVSTPDRRPDIYYIVLDRYAGPTTLESVYGIDNEPFFGALEERGFSVARDAWANYFKTAMSLTASLSMEYIAGTDDDEANREAWNNWHRGLQEPLAVPATLTDLGYEYVHIGNYWEPTATNADADIVIRWEDMTEFDAAVSATTVLALLDEPLPDDGDPETVPRGDLARESTRVGFEALEAAASRPGPTYVFAHILVPHPPYVWDADGSVPTPEEAETRTDEQKYAAQLAWTNQRVMQAIDRLLAAPAGEEPIIVLQADEGPYPERFREIGYPFKWFNATDEEVEQKFAILNAVHLPGVDPAAAGFSDHTSPVNNFRIVFNAFFGADLRLHPDVSYLSLDTFRPLELREVRRR